MRLVQDAKTGVKLVRGALRQRKSRRVLAGRLAEQEPLEPGRFTIAVYFADGAVNMYQLRQWYKPLADLAQTWPVLVLSRSSGAMNILLDEAPLPAAYVRTVADLERTIVEQDIRIVLYVNQNARNFQMMRYGGRWHVFINHGESDKLYMATNQYKAYDYALVAGEAALSRLKRVLWDYDFDTRAITIGRPQADHYADDLSFTPNGRTVVLYAPTWEGDRTSMNYGSVATHGEPLVKALLATGRHRVIYRPHPRTGVIDPEHRAANRRIIDAIESANAQDPSAGHVYDSGRELGWQLAAADVAIVDISAMVYDWLATGKPLLVTEPLNPDAAVDTSGYLGDCEWLEASDAAAIVSRLDALRNDEAAASRLAAWVEYYFGDTSPGAATRRFHAAIERLMSQWEREAATRNLDSRANELTGGDFADEDETETERTET